MIGKVLVFLADLVAYGEPVHAGKHRVEEHKPVFSESASRETGDAVRRVLHGVMCWGS